MKAKLIILILLIGLKTVVGQEIKLDKLSYYYEAYKYIKNQPEFHNSNGIAASDTIIFIDYSIFFDKLREENNYINEREDLFFYLDSIDNRIKFNPFYAVEIKNMFPNIPFFDNILFFSKVYEKSLIVEVFNSKNKENNYKKLASFSMSTIYLFYYDDDDKIRKVFSVNMAYD